MLTPHTTQKILKLTHSRNVIKTEVIQSLWNNYGELLRVHLEGDGPSSVILKYIKLPSQIEHPRGFGSDLSHNRKVKSYQVETHWYRSHNQRNQDDDDSPTANLIGYFEYEDEIFILLEDLHLRDFSRVENHISFNEVKIVLKWLANFHARFLNVYDKELWEVGTYWHLATRPDELKALEDARLRRAAPLIDKRLQKAKYQTLVHGDAKLANFLFTEDLSRVAGVDFQYIGHGPGIKDVAYFIGSCLDEEQSQNREGEILETYFKYLEEALKESSVNFTELKEEWSSLYHFAWADFHRFLKGWSPGHWKINSYSEQVTKNVVKIVTDQLLNAAKSSCLKAGDISMRSWKKDLNIQHKNNLSLANQVVTEVDLKCQEAILNELCDSIEFYDLGLLTEELPDDQSRFEKDFFWCLDPLDGTLQYSQGRPGFAISLALVSRTGESYLAVVYDPVSGNLFHATKDGGSFQNDKPLQVIPPDVNPSAMDILIENSKGGAVINILKTIQNKNTYYIKKPKEDLGGGAIWDYAAVSLILEEAGGWISDYQGNPLSYNSRDYIYYNRLGIFACGNENHFHKLKKKMNI